MRTVFTYSKFIKFCLTYTFVISITSCNQHKIEKNNNFTDSIQNTHTGYISAHNKIYSYSIADNVILHSDVDVIPFNIDSLSIYDFVKDYEGNIYHATLIDTKVPPIFQEGIYSDITDGKRKIFIYTLDEYNCNHIYIGVQLTSEQMIKAKFIPNVTNSDTIVAIRRTSLETPKQREDYLEKANREWYNGVSKNENIEFITLKI